MTVRRPRRLLLALATLAVAWACTDTSLTGPVARRLAALVMPQRFKQPFVLSGASARIDTVRVVLKKPDSTVVLDTNVFVPVGADSLRFAYDVNIAGGNVFSALLQYKSGGTVLFESSGVVAAAPAGTPSGGGGTVDIPPVLVGPGSNVANVSIAPRDTTVSFGGSVTFRTSATTAQGQPVNPFLSILSTSDANIPIQANGLVSAPALRRTIWVKVLVPTKTPAVDSTRVTFAPVPVGMRVQAGNGQAGTVGLALTQPIVARVVAADSLGVSGIPVTFTTSTPGAVISTPTVLTDSAGDAITFVTLGPLAGPQAFTATSSVGTRNFSATGNAAAPNVMAIVQGNGRTVVAGTPVDTVPTVAVSDRFGNPVPGVTVTFSVQSGGGSVSGGAAVTNAAGLASPASWTLGATAGPNTLRATLGALPPLTFTATGVPGAAALLTKVRGDLISRFAGTSVDSTPVVRVTDAGGNPVQGTVVSFTNVTGGGAVTGASVTTNAQGLAALGSWTLGTVVGPNTIRATVGALPFVTFTISGITGPATAMLKAGGDNRIATVGTPTDTAPGVLITDQFGNPVSGVTVTFAVTGGGGAITGTSQVTNAQGQARAGLWTLGTVAGTNTATASAPGLPTLTFTATAVPGAPASLTKVRGDLIARPAGAVVDSTPRVRVLDAQANPVVGLPVTFANVTGGGTVGGAATTTDAQGFAALGSWTLGTVAGPNTIQATAGALGPVTFTITGTAGAASAMAKAGGDGRVATVGTPTDTAPGVRITDALGNPVSGVAVTFAVTGGGGVVIGANQVTNAQGLARAGGWTLGATPGLNTLDATSAGLPTVSFTATGTAGAPANLLLNAGGGQTATVNTFVPVPPSVVLTDALGNPVVGATVTFSVLSGGGSITGATQVTNASGIATVGSWRLGTTSGVNLLQAATPGASALTISATGLPGAPTSVSIVAGNGQSATVGTAVAAAPTVRVNDGFGNAVGGVAVTFSTTAGNGTVTGGSQTTNALGLAAPVSWVLGTVAGTQQLTAAVVGLTSVTFTATATPGVAAAIVKVQGDGQSGPVGAPLGVGPIVQVNDANGNGVPGVVVAWTITAGGGSIANATSTTNASGQAFGGTWTLGGAVGAQTLQASAGALPPATFTATATAGAVTQLVVVSGGGQTATVATAVANPVVVRAQDGSGNPVSGQTVTFTVSSGAGTLTGASQVTNASGLATLGSWTLGTVAGVQSIVATTGPVSSPAITATGVAGSAAVVRFVTDSVLVGTVGQVATPTPAVIVQDQYGNPVAGVAVGFSASTGSTVAPTSVTTGASGIASVTTWTLGTVAGAQALTATATGVSGSKVFNATALPGPASQLLLVAGDAQNGVVNVPFSVFPAVKVIDAFSNGVSGVSVTFTPTNANSTIAGSPAVSNGAGIATAGAWTSLIVGSVAVNATVPGLNVVTFVSTAGPAGTPRLEVIRGDNQYVRTGQSALTVPVVVRAVDAAGQPVAGVPIVVTPSVSGQGTINLFGTQATDGAGRLTLTTVNFANVSGDVFFDFAASGYTGTLATVHTVGAPTYISPFGPDGQSAAGGDTLPRQLFVRVADARGLPVPLLPVVLTVSSTGTGGTAPTSTIAMQTLATDTLGFLILPVRMPAAAGPVSITASAGGLAPVRFSATSLGAPGTGTAYRIDILNGTLTGRAGRPLADTILVRERTTAGTLLAGRWLHYIVDRSDGITSPVDSVLTDATGIGRIPALVLGDSAGGAVLTVEDRQTLYGAGYLSASATISVAGAPAVLEVVSGDQQFSIPGVVLPAPVVVRVLDRAGRPVPGETVSWSSVFPSPQGGGVAGRFGVITTNALGIISLPFQIGTFDGVNRLTITVGGVSVVVTATGQTPQ